MKSTKGKMIGRAKAIHNKCYDCIYDPLEKGTKRQQSEACPHVDCALYPFRPLGWKPKDKVVVSAIGLDDKRERGEEY